MGSTDTMADPATAPTPGMEQGTLDADRIPALNELHIALYRWALEHGWLDPAKAAMRLGAPAAVVDAAVRDLTRLHLLRSEQGRQISRNPADASQTDEPMATGYTPCSPSAAAAHLVGPIEAEIRKCHRDSERIRAHVMTLDPIFKESWRGNSMSSPIEHLTEPDAVRSTLDQLSAGTRFEAATAHPLLPPQEALEEGLARTTELIGRGVSMRTIYSHSVLAHRYMQQHLGRMTELGAEIRTVGHIPDRIIFFDWETAVITDRAAENGAGAVIIRDTALVGHLQRAWESTWASARPFRSAPGGLGYGSAKEDLRRSILQLLESGMKDDVAARRLSMSTSTYRRHVTDLMNDLSAESRFQAGSYARRNGWLEG